MLCGTLFSYNVFASFVFLMKLQTIITTECAHGSLELSVSLHLLFSRLLSGFVKGFVRKKLGPQYLETKSLSVCNMIFGIIQNPPKYLFPFTIIITTSIQLQVTFFLSIHFNLKF